MEPDYLRSDVSNAGACNWHGPDAALVTMGPNITLTHNGGNGAQKIQDRLKELDRVDVLVGIPARTTPRTKQVINNASLLFIHTHGSPIRGIPARPVIEPAIAASGNKEAISTELAAAAKGRSTISKA